MVVTLIVAAFLVLGAVNDAGAARKDGSLEARIFTAPQGWKARLGTINHAVIDLYLEHLDTMPCAGGAKGFKVIHDDQEGFWLGCDVRLDGRKFEVWRDTKARIHLRNGETAESCRIIASADGCGFTLLDNARAPFVVTEKIHGHDGTVELSIRFSSEFRLEDIASWQLVNYRPR